MAAKAFDNNVAISQLLIIAVISLCVWSVHSRDVQICNQGKHYVHIVLFFSFYLFPTGQPGQISAINSRITGSKETIAYIVDSVGGPHPPSIDKHHNRQHTHTHPAHTFKGITHCGSSLNPSPQDGRQYNWLGKLPPLGRHCFALCGGQRMRFLEHTRVSTIRHTLVEYSYSQLCPFKCTCTVCHLN